MRDPERIPLLLTRLEKVWKANPDLRLGQMVINGATWPEAAFSVEDEELMEAIERVHGKMSFEKRVEHYLEYSGWREKDISDVRFWHDPDSGVSFLLADAFIRQLKEDYDKHGNIERAAEILERSK